MAASIDIMRWNGAAPGLATPITSLNTRANAEDTNSPTSTSNPIQIPSAGTNYSYWVCTRLQCGATRPADRVTNIRWFTDGSNNFGSFVSCMGNDATGYTMAVGTPGSSGTRLTAAAYGAAVGGAGGLSADPIDIFTVNSGNGYTAAQPKNIPGLLLSTDSPGPFGSFFVYQITVSAGALPGLSGQKTMTWKYDEQ